MAKGKYEPWLTSEGLTLIEGWARDGLTDEQIAHNMGICTNTLYNWKNAHIGILEALKKGKEVVDFEVENALLKRALGYTTEETRIEIMPDGSKKAVQVTREIAPDSTAAIFWLKNRKPDRWRNEHIESDKEAELLKKANDILGGLDSVIN